MNDVISTFLHEEKPHLLVNRDAKFGITDLNGKMVVALMDAVDRPKFSEDIKQMFKTVYEYSLHTEKSQQLLHTNLKKYKKIEEGLLHRIVFYSILFDFAYKCYTLQTTRKTLLDILTDTFVGIRSPFLKIDDTRSIYSNIIVRLIDIINDDEWCINFFTDYIHEMIPVSKINSVVISLDTADWEQYVIAYLMKVAICAQENQI